MRYLISLLFLIVLIVGWQRSTIAQHAPVTAIVGDRTDDFVLGWPAGQYKRACIKIPANLIGSKPPWKVNPDTRITISLVTESTDHVDWPRPFVDYVNADPARAVYLPIIRFSADRPIDLGTHGVLTIAMCTQYQGTTPTGLRLARPATSGTDPLELWDPASVPSQCNLRCGGTPIPQQQGTAIDFLGRLFAASPFSVTPLYAVPLAEGGLGGDGGSLSPFAAVKN